MAAHAAVDITVYRLVVLGNAVGGELAVSLCIGAGGAVDFGDLVEVAQIERDGGLVACAVDFGLDAAADGPRHTKAPEPTPGTPEGQNSS